MPNFFLCSKIKLLLLNVAMLAKFWCIYKAMLINVNAYIKRSLRSYKGENSPRMAFLPPFKCSSVKQKRLRSLSPASGASLSVLLLSAPYWGHYSLPLKPPVPFNLLCHILLLKDGTELRQCGYAFLNASSFSQYDTSFLK